MLKYRSFGDAKLGRNVFHARRVIPPIGKMPDGYLDDPCPLRFRTRTRFCIPSQLCWFCQTANDSLQNGPPSNLV